MGLRNPITLTQRWATVEPNGDGSEKALPLAGNGGAETPLRTYQDTALEIRHFKKSVSGVQKPIVFSTIQSIEPR